MLNELSGLSPWMLWSGGAVSASATCARSIFMLDGPTRALGMLLTFLPMLGLERGCLVKAGEVFMAVTTTRGRKKKSVHGVPKSEVGRPFWRS